jgi:serine phosphatase RsbU (regulator of sigma subunit)
VQVVTGVRKSSANGIHAAIRASLKDFVGDEPSHDDSTLIVLKFS